MIISSFVENIVTDFRFYTILDTLTGAFVLRASSAAGIIALILMFFNPEKVRKYKAPVLIVCVPILMLALVNVVNLFTNHFTINKLAEDGTVIVGRLDQEGRPDGYIKVFDSDHNIVYRGSYKNGKRDGEGSLYATEEIGEGEEVVFAYYKGEFRNGYMHGEGKTFVYAGGEVKPAYEGVFFEGKANDSEAVYYAYYNDGRLYSSYEGGWANDMRCGYGIYKRYDENGDCDFCYRGPWWDGDFCGEGVLEFVDEETLRKAVYVGEFKNGDFNGEGVLYDASGEVISCGYYRYDDCVEEMSEDIAETYPFPPELMCS